MIFQALFQGYISKAISLIGYAGSSIVRDTVMAIDASMLAILTSPSAMAGCLLSRGMKYLMILNMNNVTVRGRAIAAAIRHSGIQHTQNHNVTAVRLVPGLRLNKKKLKLLLPYVRPFLNTFFSFFFYFMIIFYRMKR